jgi:hypothetical protein
MRAWVGEKRRFRSFKRACRAGGTTVGTLWMWTLAFGHHGDRTPTHGYAESREAAMAAFAKSWRREHQ